MSKTIQVILAQCFIYLQTLSADVGEDFIAKGRGANELTTREYISLVESLLPPNPYILEAGAHSGEDTVLFAQAWPQGQVFAFEPVPLFYERLLTALEAKKIANVSAFPIGLFSSTGDQTFYYSQNCGGASSFLPEGTVPETNYNEIQMTLPCMTLDDWAAAHGVDHIDFMWLDMEGAEYHMLNASSKILDTTKVILTSLSFKNFRKDHALYSFLKPFLESRGFTLHMIWGSATWQATGLFIKDRLVGNQKDTLLLKTEPNSQSALLLETPLSSDEWASQHNLPPEAPDQASCSKDLAAPYQSGESSSCKEKGLQNQAGESLSFEAGVLQASNRKESDRIQIQETIQRTTGASDVQVGYRILNRIAEGISAGSPQERFEHASTLLAALSPKDETEALLLGQQIALQDAAMKCLARANRQEHFDHQERFYILGSQLCAQANTTMQTVLEYRSERQQVKQETLVHHEGKAMILQNLLFNKNIEGMPADSLQECFNDASALVFALNPRDETEALLLGQLIALQSAAMKCLGQANRQEHFYHQERFYMLAFQLCDQANATMQIVLQYRSGRQQAMQEIRVQNLGHLCNR